MVRSDTRQSVRLLDGDVRSVDPVGREVEVHTALAAARFDVPPDCPIVLRGERVKLRLVQPRDRVRVWYVEEQGRRVTVSIEVLTGGPATT